MCLLDGLVEKLEDEGAAGYDADATREEVVADKTLEDAALARRLASNHSNLPSRKAERSIQYPLSALRIISADDT